MIEVERKFKIKDLARFRKLVKHLGARLHEKKVQIDTYYSPPHRTFLGKPIFLRLRQTTKDGAAKYSFEYHKPYGKYVAREYETSIADGKIFKYILDQLSFSKEMVVVKKREEWKKGNIEIELDQVRGLGKFVELEIMGKSQKQALIKIDQLAQKLNLKSADLSLGYFKLLLAKKRPKIFQKYYVQKTIKN